MKDIDLTGVFCEVLGGLAFMLTLVPLLDLLSNFRLEGLAKFASQHLSSGAFAAMLVMAYLLGAVVDAFGMMFDDIWIDKTMAAKSPTDEERVHFLKNVNEHVLKYRSEQWTWYSCYRNLFLVLAPAGLCWSIALLLRSDYGPAVVVIVSVILLEIALYQAMVGLLDLYFKITKSI
jgi:hypothetical protein